MVSFQTPVLALLLAAGATTRAAALDQEAPGLRASCQTVLAGISASPYSTQELAALCRARAPSGICRDALSSLGQKPWAPARVSETCRHWEQNLEQRMLEMSPERSAQTVKDLQRSLQDKDQAPTCVGGKLLDQCASDKATDSPGAADKLQDSMQDKPSAPGPVIGGGETGLGSGINIGDKGVDIPQATTAVPDSMTAGSTVADGTSGPGGDAATTPGDAGVTTPAAGSDAATSVADAGVTTAAGTDVPTTAGSAVTTASEAASDATTTAAVGTDVATTMASGATTMTAGVAGTSTEAGTTTAADATATVTKKTKGGKLPKVGGRGTKDMDVAEDMAGKDSPKKMLPIKLADAKDVSVKAEFHEKLSMRPTAKVAGLILTGLVAMAVLAGVATSMVRTRRPVRAHRLSSLYAGSSDLEDQEEPITDLLPH